MTPLPEADPATRDLFLGWLDHFATHVRGVDYAAARPFCHPEVIAFGTHRDVIQGLETWIATQWDKVWPRTADFRFDLPATRVLMAADRSLAVLIAPWDSTGFHPDATPFDRPGRATMVLAAAGEAWVIVHSHMSLNRGVPQDSFADRPVAAR